MSASVSGRRVSSSERLSRGEITENEGFSVVAAISVTSRFSTAGSSTSCWVLENRCTSSTNSTVAQAAGQLAVGIGKGRPDLLDPSCHGGELNEPALAGRRDHSSDGGLAHARRTPEEDRHGRPALGQSPQRRTRAEEVVLADDLVDGAGPHPDGQRGVDVAGGAQRATRWRRGRAHRVAEEIRVHRADATPPWRPRGSRPFGNPMSPGLARRLFRAYHRYIGEIPRTPT